MSVDAKDNISASCENALILAMIAQDTSMVETLVAYRGFQVSAYKERKFPQIQLACAPDIPDGFKSETRKVPGALAVITHVDDDPLRADLAKIYKHVRATFDAANNNVATFLSTYLPSGWHFGGIVVTDSAIPYFEDNYAILELSFEMEICAP